MFRRNSKILDREFGYWAEQIPAIDSPLCAVVDPMKDYRWHSLRCGGPDVASFLCEMEGTYTESSKVSLFFGIFILNSALMNIEIFNTILLYIYSS